MVQDEVMERRKTREGESNSTANSTVTGNARQDYVSVSQNDTNNIWNDTNNVWNDTNNVLEDTNNVLGNANRVAGNSSSAGGSTSRTAGNSSAGGNISRTGTSSGSAERNRNHVDDDMYSPISVMDEEDEEEDVFALWKKMPEVEETPQEYDSSRAKGLAIVMFFIVIIGIALATSM